MNKLVGLAIVLICAGCSSPDVEKRVDHKNLVHAWELVELHGQSVVAEKPVYIEFTENNKVTGFAGCNRINGSFKVVKGDKIGFGQLGVTRMTCPAIETENKFVKTLNAGSHFKVEGNRLIFSTDDEQIVAVFVKIEGHDIVNRKWKLKSLKGQPISKVKNQLEPQYFILNEDSTMAGFAGCNAFNGEYEMEGGNRIRFKRNMAVTLKACPDVDIDERAFLSVFEKVDSYDLRGDTLSLHVGSQAKMAVFVVVPATK